jgi:hypothetical protein
MLLVSILGLAIIASTSTVKIAEAQGHPGPYYTVQPSKTIMGPFSAIGQTFTVSIKLLNVTTDNVPAGISGVEVHLTWNNTLIEPVSFVVHTGESDGVLLGPNIVAGESAGFYKDNTTTSRVNSAPYTNATFFSYAAASTSGGWWNINSTDALIADITFKVDFQPLLYANSTLHFEDLLDYLADSTSATVPHEVEDGLLLITNAQTATVPINFQGVGNYTVSIQSDSKIDAPANLNFLNDSTGGTFSFNVTSPDGFCNVTIPRNFMSGNWNIKVDNQAPISQVITNDTTNTYVWFNFTAGAHIITIHNDRIVPEFSSASLILFLMGTTLIVTAVAANLRRKKLHR